MTERIRGRITIGLVMLCLTAGGLLAGVCSAWGVMGNRIAVVEREVDGIRRDVVPAIYRIDRSLGGIEQMLREHERRLDRIERRELP